MITLRKQQHVEAIYFNNIYIRIDLVTYQEKTAFITSMLSLSEDIYEGNPFMLDYDMPPQVRATLACTTINSLREEYEYLNEKYHNLIRKIDDLRHNFINNVLDKNLSENEQQISWNQHKLINLEVEEMEFLEPFQRISNHINSQINEEINDPEQLRLIVESSYRKFLK